jgi:hypothetical protein
VSRVLLAVAIAAAAAAPSWAGAPVTLTDNNVGAANAVTYTAGPFPANNQPTPGVGGPYPTCDTTHPCDDTPLTVNVSSPALLSTYRIKITSQWPDQQFDFDLYLYKASTLIASDTSTADPEHVQIPIVNAGDYLVRIVPFTGAGTEISTVKIFLEAIPADPVPPAGPVARFQVFPTTLVPGLGEPSVGVNWKTGAVTSQSDVHTLFTTFDDSCSPALDTWAKRDAPTSQVDEDPILFTDSQTGRTFASLLITDSVTFSTGCSEKSHTDDDGNTWVPNDGCGHPAGSDHQSVGGGPYHAPLTPGAAYPNAVYYCAQDPNPVTPFSPALCARSDDGGATFGPSVAASNFQCGGIHGHLKVAPDGTVYLPQRECNNPSRGGEIAVLVSTDNGLTWAVRTVPGSNVSASDPSVATGLNDVGKPAGQASNTLYEAYCDQVDANHGLAKVAVSHDQGQTWVNVFDVGAAAGIQNCVFAEMAAGDDNRAAMFFLGTTTPGNTQDDNYNGVWYPYVAMTFDGGAHWGLTNVTPGDPVQIGKICLGGISCTGGRNLLDFNDLAVDKQGRLVGVFADGCLPPGCTPATATAHPAPYNESRNAQHTLLRQSGGKRLFAAYDPAEPGIPAPPRLVSAVRGASGVVLSWMVPDDGGSPVTLYQIYRGTAPGQETYLTNASATTAQYTDTTAAPGVAYWYQVAAYNQFGPGGFCGEIAVSSGPPVESLCLAPGITQLMENTSVNDAADGQDVHDLVRVGVSQPYVNGGAKGDYRVGFHLKVRSLSTLTPNTIYFSSFTGPDGVLYGARMVVSNTATASFESYRVGAANGGQTDGRFVVAGSNKPADPASNYTADGNIAIFVKPSDIGITANGQSLTNFNAAVAQTAGGVVTTILDGLPSDASAGGAWDGARTGAVQIKGNCFCSPGIPPLAVLAANPQGGAAPVTINFDGSGSNDSVDAIDSYVFDFGDGSAKMTTKAPTATASHQYTRGGTFPASLVVTDTCGHPSTNNAEVQITVTGKGPGTSFYTLTPCRVIDTRTGAGPFSSGTAHKVFVAGSCGIPAGAIAVSLNVTVTQPTSDGYLALFGNLTDPPPSISTINFRTGLVRANNAVITLNSLQSDGSLYVLPGMRDSNQTVNVILDVNGYFAVPP